MSMKRWMATGLLLSVAACGGSDGDEGVGHTGEAATTLQPIFLHAAFLQKASGGPDGARSATLQVPGALNIVSTESPTNPGVAPWKAAGGKTAKHIAMNVVLDDLAKGIDALATPLTHFDYVAIDELEYAHGKGGKAGRIRDGEKLTPAFVKLLEQHSGKVILYVNTYNMAGAPAASANNELRLFKDVLGACATHCLALGSELYLATGEAWAKGSAGAGGCANGLRCHGWATRQLLAVAPGLKSKIVEVLDVRDKNKPASNPKSFCEAGGGGALRREMAKSRALGLRGVGTYALSYVAVGAEAKFASCFRYAASYFTSRRGLAPASITPTLAPRGFGDPTTSDDQILFADPEIASDPDPDFVDVVTPSSPPEPAGSMPADPSSAPAPSPSPAPAQAPRPTACGVMKPGETLYPGDSVAACDGLSLLVHQTDGNVVLYEKYPNHLVPVWSTATNGQPTSTFVVQGDGNVVLYGPNGALWNAGTQNHAGAELRIQDDCRAAATAGGAALWSTGSSCRYDAVTMNEAFVASYLTSYNPDVASYGAAHAWTPTNYQTWWTSSDANECRQASPVFHSAYYNGANPDVNAAYGGSCAKAVSHWLSSGNREGRRSSAQFDPKFYLSANPDIADAYGPHNYGKAAWHYLHAGINEGRKATP